MSSRRDTTRCSLHIDGKTILRGACRISVASGWREYTINGVAQVNASPNGQAAPYGVAKASAMSIVPRWNGCLLLPQWALFYVHRASTARLRGGVNNVSRS